jgi:hypothetical protein
MREMKSAPGRGRSMDDTRECSPIAPQLNGVKSDAPMVCVYDGRRCVGFVLAVGREGFEACDADGASLGKFPNMRDAAAAVSARANGGAL